MSQLSMTQKEFMWGEALTLALLPQVGGKVWGGWASSRMRAWCAPCLLLPPCGGGLGGQLLPGWGRPRSMPQGTLAEACATQTCLQLAARQHGLATAALIHLAAQLCYPNRYRVPLHCRPLQEGPEANVHTPWHGKSPTSIAGTVVYIIANLPGKTHVALHDICRTCGVADGTIRQIYREIHPHLKTLIDKAGGFATHADIDRLPLPVESAGNK